MELTNTETLGPVAADNWRSLSNPATGPGVYVFFVDCPLSDTETLQAAVMVDPEGFGKVLVEDFTAVPTDLSTNFASAGFQSAPVPLVDDTWQATVRAKHDSATDKTFTVRVIKL